jgi:hypothetical protein
MSLIISNDVEVTLRKCMYMTASVFGLLAGIFVVL